MTRTVLALPTLRPKAEGQSDAPIGPNEYPAKVEAEVHDVHDATSHSVFAPPVLHHPAVFFVAPRHPTHLCQKPDVRDGTAHCSHRHTAMSRRSERNPRPARCRPTAEEQRK
jgi:hypothetical protein